MTEIRLAWRRASMCYKLALLTIEIKLHPMKMLMGLLVAVILLGTASGCKSDTGSREFIPGRGWVPTH